MEQTSVIKAHSIFITVFKPNFCVPDMTKVRDTAFNSQTHRNITCTRHPTSSISLNLTSVCWRVLMVCKASHKVCSFCLFWWWLSNAKWTVEDRTLTDIKNLKASQLDEPHFIDSLSWSKHANSYIYQPTTISNWKVLQFFRISYTIIW